MLQDGCRVEYTGHGNGPLIPGDQGSVLVVSGHCAHVQWKTGPLADQVSLVDTVDLVLLSSRQSDIEESLSDSLEVSGLGSVTARRIFDDGGSQALLSAMVEAGSLASFQDVAEDALALIAGRLRNSSSFMGITSHLDEDEIDTMVNLASTALIKDALGTS